MDLKVFPLVPATKPQNDTEKTCDTKLLAYLCIIVSWLAVDGFAEFKSWGIETNSLSTSNKRKMRLSILFDVFWLLMLNMALVATMDTDSSSTKSMKVPVFSHWEASRKQDFQVLWWMRLLQVICHTLMGFAAVTGKTKENDLPEEEEEKQADTGPTFKRLPGKEI